MGHPYFPPDAAIPHYQPNTRSLLVLFVLFGSILGGALGSVWMLAKTICPRFSNAPASQQALFLWFALCGSLHCFFEGYFVLNHATIAGSQSLPAQLWKEYALSDSRYLTSDPFMLCIEAVTVVVWGPLCWAAAAAIAQGHRRRHALQVVAGVAHLYGVVLYYGTVAATERLQGVSYCRPEAVYLWVYFIGMNVPWVVVPAVLLWSNLREIGRALGDESKKTR